VDLVDLVDLADWADLVDVVGRRVSIPVGVPAAAIGACRLG